MLAVICFGLRIFGRARRPLMCVPPATAPPAMAPPMFPAAFG